MEEVFKQINGYENYSISNFGRVKNSRNTIMKFYKINSGYFCVKLWKNNKSKAFLIHRLVAEYFLENNNNLNIVDHIDSNRENNYYNNLRWSTQHENVLYYKENKIDKIGLNHPMCKFSERDIKNIRKMFNDGFKRKEIAIWYNCSRSTIENVINNKYNYTTR